MSLGVEAEYNHRVIAPRCTQLKPTSNRESLINIDWNLDMLMKLDSIYTGRMIHNTH
jgi:hypothetical protein